MPEIRYTMMTRLFVSGDGMEPQGINRAALAPGAGPTIHVGLIGHGISLSRTPKMHVEEGQALGFDYRYDLFDVAEDTIGIGTILDRVERAGLRGVNVTHPFKQTVIPHIDDLSTSAAAVNAVNTVVFRDGKRFGHNTDYWGFFEAFRTTMGDRPHKCVLLLGAGGAGGAVAHALLDAGVCTLFVHDVNPKAARTLTESLNARLGEGRARQVDDPAAALNEAQGLVNATPVGMADHPGCPIPAAAVNPRLWVVDIIYFPLETELLRIARAAGCHTMDGSGMAVFQAVRAFALFTGAEPDPKRMRATFDAFAAPGNGR